MSTAEDAAHRGPVERRRSSALRLVNAADAVATRIAVAPPGYLLSQDSSDIARQCALVSPMPATSEARVVATPGRAAGEWHLDVASRDRAGLLAAFSGVLTRADIDVVQAVLATWDDGAALEAFVVRSARPPDPHALQRAFESSLRKRLASPAVADADVTFDDGASSLYTRCDVRAADRPGLLDAVAVAIADAGADVHAARVTTVDGFAHDRFDLSDRAGHKLGSTLRKSICASLRHGVSASWSTRRRAAVRR
jgi:[protein-PII] uridylyltransferase